MRPAIDTPIPRLVADWTNRMSAIARNLIDFNESENARRMKARLLGPSRAYSGQTAAAARGASEKLDGLWRDYLLVSRVVDDAAALSRKSGLLSNNDDAVRALLEGTSIEMPAISVPVSRRGLLDGAERITRARPDDVLDSMLNAFAKARDVVGAIADAETTITSRVQASRAEAKALGEWAKATGEDIGPLDITMLDAAEADPLAAIGRVSEAEAALAGARATMREIEAGIANLRLGLGQAETRLITLRDIRAKADEAIARTMDLFGAPAAMAVEDPVPALEAWLKTLRETSGTRWKAAAIGFARWDDACRAHLDAATRAHAAARAALDAMENIKGRFRALRVKAARIASTSASKTADVADLDASARESLERRPFVLDEAKRRVDAFEAALAGDRVASSMENGRS